MCKSHRRDFPNPLSRNDLLSRRISRHMGKNTTFRHEEGGGKMICLLLLLSPMRYPILAMQSQVSQLMSSIESAALSSLHRVNEDEGGAPPPKGRGVDF